MSNCGENGQDDSIGVLDQYTAPGIFFWTPPDRCSDNDTRESEYDLHVATSAQDVNNGYDAIQKGSTRDWYTKSFFKNKPSSLLDDNCIHNCPFDDCEEPAPLEVEYELEHGTGYDTTNYEFAETDKQPDGDESDGSHGDGIIGSVLAVVGALSGNVWVSSTAALIGSFIDGGASDPVTTTHTETGNEETVTWSIKMDGQNLSDFPDSKCDATGVKYRVENKSSNDNYCTAYTAAAYTIRMPEYGNDNCPCEAMANVYQTIRTTSYVTAAPEYENIE